MFGVRARQVSAPRRQHQRGEGINNDGSDGEDEEEGVCSGGRLSGWLGMLPGWAFLPLTSVFVVLLLLACMLPVYYDFIKISAQQDEALIWPLGMRYEDMDDMDQFNVELDLISITAEAREVGFLFDLKPGGTYEHDTDAGVLELDDLKLSLTLGHQSLEYKSGDAVSDVNVVVITEDTSPLFQYPFDEYTIDMSIRATLVDDTDPANTVSRNVDIGLVLYEGEQGWETKSELLPMLNKNGDSVPGVVIHMTIKRSGSVKFFSLFIIILMWAISLAMFVIALNFVFSNSLEVAYDIPGLAVGLLFALPFVRAVQPGVPTIGITIDIMGFFFNMILIAAATVMVMAALTSRYRRSLQLKEARRAAKRKQRDIEQPYQVSLAHPHQDTEHTKTPLTNPLLDDASPPSAARSSSRMAPEPSSLSPKAMECNA